MIDAQRKFDFVRHELKRLENIYKNIEGEVANIEAESQFHNFCAQCYHFKDWLIDDFPEKKDIIEEFITKSEHLCICADITTKDKHKKLNKKSRSGKDVKKGNNHFFLDIGSFGVIKRNKFDISIDGKKIDCLEIAKGAFSEWIEFLNKNNLI